MLELGYLSSRGIVLRSQQSTHLETAKGNCQNDILTVGAVSIFHLSITTARTGGNEYSRRGRAGERPPHQNAR